jgi:DNA-binding transcriptional regulator YiaG
MTREDVADLVLARVVVAGGMAKSLRESVNLSRPEFVAATDGAFSVAALRAWEAGQRRPRGSQGIAYGKALREVVGVES